MSYARKRQKATGEQYMTALMHVRGQCGRCCSGDPCRTCIEVEPCWACLPVCIKRPGIKRCHFDDLQPDGTKRCAYCNGRWLPLSEVKRA